MLFVKTLKTFPKLYKLDAGCTETWKQGGLTHLGSAMLGLVAVGIPGGNTMYPIVFALLSKGS